MPVARPCPCPPLLVNAITGQAGFLTAALFIGGMALLPKRPFVAGLLLGLLVREAAARPGAASGAARAGREWRAIAGAAASVDRPRCSSASLVFGWRVLSGLARQCRPVRLDRQRGAGRLAPDGERLCGALRFAGLAMRRRPGSLHGRRRARRGGRGLSGSGGASDDRGARAGALRPPRLRSRAPICSSTTC